MTLTAEKPVYRYRLTSTDGNSGNYGNCDICRGHCTEVFIQTEEKKYSFNHGNKTYEGWTQHKCNSYFGHRQCLEEKQR